jgi:hypothetical protein
MTTTMRFYRAAIHDAWQTNNAIRRASQQIYVTKALPLAPGENWWSLFFDPDTNTIASIFGTNRIPGGSLPGSDASSISWFGGDGKVTQEVRLSTSSGWLRHYPAGDDPANNYPLPLGQGFMITLPTNATPTNLIVVGRLPTNSPPPQTVRVGTNYNILSYNVPRRMRVDELGLKEMGFRGGPNKASNVDELRILTNHPAIGRGSMSSPRLRVWLKSTDGNFYDWTTTTLNRNAAMIEPDETIILYMLQGGSDMVWTNNPLRFYSVPGKNVNP